ncbi:MAG: nitroreductase family protein [Bacteroidota bacterium]|jgi:nitroreductase
MRIEGNDYTRYECLKELCENRKSRRTFTDAPIPEDFIEKILSIAATSPYASGKQNWEITVLKDRATLIRMADAVEKKSSGLITHLDEEYAEGFREYASNFLFFKNAPAVFVLSFRSQKSISLMLNRVPRDAEMESASSFDSEGRKMESVVSEWERDSFVKSISCVAMLVLLAAESLGLAACYMTGPLIAEKEIGDILHLKKGRNIGAIIPVGYYDMPDSTEKTTDRERTDSEQKGTAS